MDLVSSALDVAVSAANATKSLHKLCEDWPDCPHIIRQLTDDLERVNIFLYAPSVLD